MKSHVILSDGMLGGNMDDLLSQIMRVGDALNEGDLEIKSRRELATVLVEAVDKDCVLLVDDDERAEDISVGLFLEEKVATWNGLEKRTRGWESPEHYILI